MQEKSRNKIQASESMAVVMLITLSGGLQDAYTYIVRGKVFANAQTGNIVLLSSSLFSGNWGGAFSYLIPLLSFALGILVAALLKQGLKERYGIFHWRHATLAAEIVMLTLVAFMPVELSKAANAMVSFSCALQVESFRKARGYAYASTMCIGNLKSCMENAALFITGEDKNGLRKAGYYAAVILFFAIGAGLGALLSGIFGLQAILFSAALLILASILMLGRKES